MIGLRVIPLIYLWVPMHVLSRPPHGGVNLLWHDYVGVYFGGRVLV
jgi:hypothetical protein